MRMNPMANQAQEKLKSDVIKLNLELPNLEIENRYDQEHELCKSVADDHSHSLKTKLIMSSGLVIELHQSNEFCGFIVSNASGRYTLDAIHNHLYFEPAGTRHVEVPMTEVAFTKKLSKLLQAKFLDN
jgi:hypothetical protein